MERAKDRTSTPGHSEAGCQEGITNDPSWQETLPSTCDAIAPETVLSLPPRGDLQAPRRDRYVSVKAVMDPTPWSPDAEMGSGRTGASTCPLRSSARRGPPTSAAMAVPWGEHQFASVEELT